MADYLKENFENEIFTSEQLKEHFNNTMFHGNEIDTTMLRIGTMNMLLHDVENPQIHYVDSLSKSNKEREKYTLVLANPPFKGSLDKEAVADDLTRITNTGKTELLFIGLILELLKSGGRAGVIVPDGVLFGASNAHKSLRKEIIDKHKLEGVISMPSGVFKPYTGVSTAILLFTKTGIGGTDKVWFYDMQADGLSLDDKREKIEDNDIEDIIARFHKLEDDILISLTGNVGRVAKLEKKFLPAALNQRVACVRANKRISDEYLYYMLNSNYFENKCASQSKGVAQKNLGITNLKKIKIPVPPMEIQEKIVKVLDQAQALIDKRKEQKEALDQLIESIFYTMFGDPVRNEKGWEVKELEEVLLNNVGNIKKDFKDDISYIDIGSINNNNNSIETYNNFKIKDSPSRAKRILNHGDILFSTVRPNLKNIAIFDMYTENTAIALRDFVLFA